MHKLSPKAYAQLDGSAKAKLTHPHRPQYQSTPEMALAPQGTTVYREPKHQLGAPQGHSATAPVLALQMNVLIAHLVSTAEATITPL